MPLFQGLPGQPLQAHEVHARDGVALDEFEDEQDDHARKPGNADESPPVIEFDDQPDTRDQQQDGAGDHYTVVEHRDIPDGLGKAGQLTQLACSQIGDPYADESPPMRIASSTWANLRSAYVIIKKGSDPFYHPGSCSSSDTSRVPPISRNGQLPAIDRAASMESASTMV